MKHYCGIIKHTQWTFVYSSYFRNNKKILQVDFRPGLNCAGRNKTQKKHTNLLKRLWAPKSLVHFGQRIWLYDKIINAWERDLGWLWNMAENDHWTVNRTHQTLCRPIYRAIFCWDFFFVPLILANTFFYIFIERNEWKWAGFWVNGNGFLVFFSAFGSFLAWRHEGVRLPG